VEDGTFTTCPGCGQRVDPDDPANLRAVELVDVGTFGTPADNNDKAEGMGAAFHPACFNPSDLRWRLAN
jgi:hypothetical protein